MHCKISSIAAAIALLFSFQSFASAAIVGHYTFDEGSGTTAFDSANGPGAPDLITGALGDNTATPVDDGTLEAGAASPTYVPGFIGSGALSFDGGDSVNIGPNQDMAQSVSAFTLAAWVRPTQVGTVARNIVALSHGTNVGQVRAGLSLNTAGQFQGRGRDGDGGTLQSKTATTALTLDTWTHVAAVIDYANDSILLYVNGVSVPQTGTITFATTSTLATPSLTARIGSLNTATNEPFIGQIDDVRLYNEVLTSTQISDLAAVPEPSSMILAGLGVIGLIGIARRRKAV